MGEHCRRRVGRGKNQEAMGAAGGVAARRGQEGPAPRLASEAQAGKATATAYFKGLYSLALRVPTWLQSLGSHHAIDINKDRRSLLGNGSDIFLILERLDDNRPAPL
jgi:hypothetical protein